MLKSLNTCCEYGNYVCMETMVLYGIVIWMAMFLYGTCMEVFVWILVVPLLWFS